MQKCAIDVHFFFTKAESRLFPMDPERWLHVEPHISMPSLLSGTFPLRLPPTGPTTHASRRPMQCAIPPGGSNSTRALRRPRPSSSTFINREAPVARGG